MLRTRTRIGIAIGSVFLSLPAFLAAYAGAFFVYAFAVLGGYNGTALDAVRKLLSTWKGCITLFPAFLILIHIGLFLYLLVRFARGLPLPRFAQLYCVTVVIWVIGERIRLQIVEGNALFWFGAFSVPHALCLFAIVKAGADSARARPHRCAVRQFPAA
jgi:hypothetical protein